MTLLNKRWMFPLLAFVSAGLCQLPFVNIVLMSLTALMIALGIGKYVLCHEDVKSSSERLLQSSNNKKENVYYLTNIKSFLTFIVVAHHIMGAFSGSGWYYGLSAYRNVFVVVWFFFCVSFISAHDKHLSLSCRSDLRS